MPRVGPLWGSVGIQGLGAVATLSTGLAIAAWQGPLAQGGYALVRSSADLLVAVVLFGLPQSIVHSINHKRAMPAALALWGRRYASGLLSLTVLIGALSWSLDGKLRPQWLGSDLAWVLFLTGSVGWVYHGLQRVFALCLGGDLRFALLSAVPSVSLLVAV